MTQLTEICKWLEEQCGDDALAISVRFNEPPKNKGELCLRAYKIFHPLYKKLLRRQWNKQHAQHFVLIGFQEYGKFGNLHAHFVLGIKRVFTSEQVIVALKTLKNKFMLDVWENEDEKIRKPKEYGGEIMIQRIYSNGAYSYLIKELKITHDWHLRDNMILCVDLFGK